VTRHGVADWVPVSESSVEASPAPAAGPTGDERVDRIVGRLDILDDLDLPGRLAAFSEMQAALSAVLDDDETAGPPTSAPTPDAASTAP
jgi:hypothetical protein